MFASVCMLAMQSLHSDCSPEIVGLNTYSYIHFEHTWIHKTDLPPKLLLLMFIEIWYTPQANRQKIAWNCVQTCKCVKKQQNLLWEKCLQPYNAFHLFFCFMCCFWIFLLQDCKYYPYHNAKVCMCIHFFLHHKAMFIKRCATLSCGIFTDVC